MKISIRTTAIAGLVAAGLAVSAQVARADVFQAKWVCPDGTWWVYTVSLNTGEVISRVQAKPVSECDPNVAPVARVAPQARPAPVNHVGPVQPSLAAHLKR